MSRFSDSDSRLRRILARNQGRLLSGLVREALGKAWLKPRFRRIVRPFLREKQPEKWLFVVGCFNSGTTILRRLLESHPDISAMVREGAKMTDAFPNLERGGWKRMMYANRHLWDLPAAGAAARAARARRDWSFWFDRRARVFFEKSIDHTTRMAWMDAHFRNAHFIAIRRNGYCVNEGIMRRARPEGEARAAVGDTYPPALCAEQWVAFDRLLDEGCAAVARSIAIRYEDLMADPVPVMRSLFRFLGLSEPAMHWDGRILTIGDDSHELADQNARSLARLSTTDIAAMRPIMANALARHGYTDRQD